MDISYLKTVLTVAKHLSFSRAAEEIPCSQATVSRQINDVEESLGYKLFHRTINRGVLNVTEKGQIAIMKMQDILCLYEELFDCTDEGQAQNYRLGIPTGLLTYKAKARLVADVFAKHPDINLQLVETERNTWINLLLDSTIDGLLMLTIEDAQKPPKQQSFLRENGFDYTFIKRQLPSIAMPYTHRLAQRQTVAMEELAQETFLFNRDISILKEKTSNLFISSFLKSCSLAGFEPRLAHHNKIGKDFANIRDASILSSGCIYPTFQFEWGRNEDTVFVPLQEPTFCADFYFVTMEREVRSMDFILCSCLQELCNSVS